LAVQFYGYGTYGSLTYSGNPIVYIVSDVTFIFPTVSYVPSDVFPQITKNDYLPSEVTLQIVRQAYLPSDVELVHVRSEYVPSGVLLNKLAVQYILSNVHLSVELSPYEVDEFQIIVDRQFAKFYWKDSSPGSNKTYTIYESLDDGITWSLLTTTTGLTYQLNQIPFDIPSRVYKITITTGPSVSFGLISYPTFSFRRILNSLDNGYWDVDPDSNIYKIHEGIAKEAHCRAELEIDYTRQDESILNIRNSRISDVYGIPFSQTTLSADEEYRRKIWNLFLGFRNTMTYDGVYSVVKAFTHVPPRIKPLRDEGWILGLRYLGVDTIPLSELTALYGVKFEIHMYQNTAGRVDTTDTTSVFNAISTVTDGFNPTNDFYKNNYLVFKTGQNLGSSRQILSSFTLPAPHDSTTRFTTNAFAIADTSANNTFFVTNTSTDTIETYVKEVIPLHSKTLFLYFSEYITENQFTGFTGTLNNIELIPSERLRVKNVSNTVDDEGKTVQAYYESGVALSKAYPLSSFGSSGIICWDMINWGDSGLSLKMYISYTSDINTPDWTYQSGLTNYIQFTNLTEVPLAEYIKTNSDVVSDSTGYVFIRNTDYVVDYRNGTIRKTLTSAIPYNAIITVKYNTEFGEVTQNQTLNFGVGQNFFAYKMVLSGLTDRSDWEFSGFYLKKLS
jgi:hypothetical protein